MISMIASMMHSSLGIFYLFLCFTTGWTICSIVFPDLYKVTEQDYGKKSITVSPFLILLPAWFIAGTLSLTWVTYLTALLFSFLEEPLVMGNAFSMTFAMVGAVLAFYLKKIEKKRTITGSPHKISLLCSDAKTRKTEMLLLGLVILLAGILMWTTFYIKGDKLYIGISVFSDFSPHIGMIRSFSYGNNFPTTYSHFAGEDIKYHFMFQFLVGNLEFLGLRLDYAFNIPSMISFTSAFLLLYVLAVKITGKTGAGILACLFFAFRSSKTLFTWLAHLPAGTDIKKALLQNTNFLGTTPNEDWGLWNLNVYCNQRHLAFGIAVILLIILLFLPLLYETFELSPKPRYRERFLQIFFSKEGWYVKNIREPVGAGIILGSLAFFHGAAEIAALLVLFAVGILARRRMELVIAAVITLFLTLLQTKLFIHSSSAVSAKFLFGFLAENKTIFGVASYLARLLGILPLVLAAAICIEKAVGKYLLFAFTLPLVFAFTVSLTVDVTVNHKYVMISSILLGIFAAAVVMRMLEQKDILIRLCGILLILALTATGFYDFTTVIRKNRMESPIVLECNDPLTDWIRENSNSQDIFLTSNYSINQVVFGGAMLYEGWEYFGWSAGYDTDNRDEMVKRMYEAAAPEELDVLVKKNKIRFIIVDWDNRNSQVYSLNEDTIKAAYQCVKEFGDGDWKTSIYDTAKPIYE